MIKLGSKVRDKVTGFEGICTGRASYIYGCDQYNIVPQAEAGKISDTHWFDEGRIEVIGDGINKAQVVAKKPGGPQRDSPR